MQTKKYLKTKILFVISRYSNQNQLVTRSIFIFLETFYICSNFTNLADVHLVLKNARVQT